MTKNTSQDEGQPSPKNGPVPPMTPYKNMKAQYEQLYAQYPEDAANLPKVRIAYCASFFGVPCLYLGLAPAAFYYPEIATWLGLDTFAQYLMQRQSGDYQTLAQAKNSEFADNFSRLHAASLLMAFISCIPALIGAEIYRKTLSQEYRNKKTSISLDYTESIYPKKLVWVVLIVVPILIFISLLNFPILETYYGRLTTAAVITVFVVFVGAPWGIKIYRKYRKPKHKTKIKKAFWAGIGCLLMGSFHFWGMPTMAISDGAFSIISGGLGTFVVVSSIIMTIFVSGSIAIIYIDIRDHYWPKLQNLITKTKTRIS